VSKKQLGVVDVYKKAFHLLFLKEPKLFILSLIFIFLLFLLSYAVFGTFYLSFNDFLALSSTSIQLYDRILILIIGGALVTTYYYLMTIAFYIGAKRVLDGKKIKLIDLLRESPSYIIKFFIVSILVGLITFAGFLLFVIPGFVFLLVFAYALPATIYEEKRIINTLKYSWHIGLKNIKTTIKFLIVSLVISVPYILASYLFDFTLRVAFNMVWQAIITPFGIIALSILYLKGIKK